MPHRFRARRVERQPGRLCSPQLHRSGHRLLMKIEVVDRIVLGLAMADRPKDYSSLRELGIFIGESNDKAISNQGNRFFNSNRP